MEMSFEPDATSLRPLPRAGEYDLIRRMGSGGFGVVFEARHRESKLPYAVKRIELSVEDAERFHNEAIYPARIAAQSLHVLGVHSFFHDDSAGVFYLVTELIPHGDLRTFLTQQPKPLPLALALQVATGIAKGLAAIHAQGIVHRDLKPANVLMDRKDDVWVPKIADFGLARSTRSVSLGEFASSGYAAPEQLDLLSDTPPGPEADLFSFGMVLYEVLTGRPAAPAKDLRDYGRFIAARRLPPSPNTVRPELARWPALESLLGALLTFDPARRRITAQECAQTLQRVLHEAQRADTGVIRRPSPAPVPAPDPGPGPEPGPTPPHVDPSPRPLDRRRTQPKPKPNKTAILGVLGVVTVVVLGVVATGGWFAWRWYSVTELARRGQAAYEARQFTDAYTLLREASDAGNPKAQAHLGLMFLGGYTVTRNYAEAKRLLDSAAAAGDPTGHAGLGWMALMGNGMPKDVAEGVRHLKLAADGNDRTGLAWLGWAYENGTGVAKDERAALAYYQRAADAGSLAALYGLGRFHRDGLGGLPRSLPNAVPIFTRAAEKGDAASQCALGDISRDRFLATHTRTTPASLAASDTTAGDAVKWYRQAADQHEACGENGLGYLHRYGYGVPVSYDEAVRWYERAEARDSQSAQQALARMRTEWDYAPLFPGPWRGLTGADRRREVEALTRDGALAGAGASDPRRLRRLDLDFYDGGALYELEVARADGTPGVFAYVRVRDRLIRLNGSSAPIKTLNAAAPIRLDSTQRAAAYLRFYMGAFQGNAGTIRVVDSGADLLWLSSAPSFQRSTTSLRVLPAIITSTADGWQVSATVQYDGSLYRLSRLVKTDGTVENSSSERIALELQTPRERFDANGLRGRALNAG
jgi:serine/threonine protein kinase/TPR repeat protein